VVVGFFGFDGELVFELLDLTPMEFCTLLLVLLEGVLEYSDLFTFLGEFGVEGCYGGLELKELGFEVLDFGGLLFIGLLCFELVSLCFGYDFQELLHFAVMFRAEC
jgi:hypothetical protein